MSYNFHDPRGDYMFLWVVGIICLAAMGIWVNFIA